MTTGITPTPEFAKKHLADFSRVTPGYKTIIEQDDEGGICF